MARTVVSIKRKSPRWVGKILQIWSLLGAGTVEYLKEFNNISPENLNIASATVIYGAVIITCTCILLGVKQDNE